MCINDSRDSPDCPHSSHVPRIDTIATAIHLHTPCPSFEPSHGVNDLAADEDCYTWRRKYRHLLDLYVRTYFVRPSPASGTPVHVHPMCLASGPQQLQYTHILRSHRSGYRAVQTMTLRPLLKVPGNTIALDWTWTWLQSKTILEQLGYEMCSPLAGCHGSS